MDDHGWIAERFEENRRHLRSVAYRMLGSTSEADDAVQETWLRLNRSDTSDVENLGGWLTTVVARVCLDMLRARRTRREEPGGVDTPEPGVSTPEPGVPGEGVIDPEQEAVLGDSVGLALLVVLEALAPGERVAFVLHDLFGVPFEEIAPIVGRSPKAARQLASRARRRVRGAEAPGETDRLRQRQAVEAFLAASRNGDFEALLAVLDPDVVARADRTVVRMGATGEVRGAAAVARTFAGRARAARPALVNGEVGLVWAQHGVPQVVFDFTIAEGKIVEIELIGERERLEQLDVVSLDQR